MPYPGCLETQFHLHPMQSTSGPDTGAQSLGSSLFPLQCDFCGRELVNIGCSRCFPPEPSSPSSDEEMASISPARLAQLKCAEKNHGGFPRYGQLRVGAPPDPVEKHPKPPPVSLLPTPYRHFQFRGDDGRLLKISDGTGYITLTVRDGKLRPFLGRLKEGETFTLLTKFEWGPHKWETSDIDISETMTETALFKCICIYFMKFLRAMEKCHNSETCLCGSDSSIAEREVNILEYQLFADKSKSFKMTVIAGTGV